MAAPSDAGLPLVAKLQEIFSSSEDLLITLLLDSSGSIGSQYETLRKLCLELVEKLQGVATQVIQFSSVARTECPFTTDLNMLKVSLTRMVHMAASTNMAEGFRLTKTSLFRTITEKSVPVVFLITDGEPTGENPQKEIQELLSLNPRPEIIGIGVGSGTNVDKLRRILPGQQVYHMSDYTHLNAAIKALVIKPQEIEPAIRISFTPVNTELQKSRSNLIIQVTCEPDQPLTALPVGTEIRFLANEFFFGASITLSQAALKDRPYTDRVTLKIKPNAIHYGDFPDKLWYEAVIPSSKRGRYKGYVQMLLGWFAGDLLYPQDPSRNLNILVWGPMGSGKTSLINGFITVLSHDQTVKNPLTAYRSEGHVTKTYSRNAITDWIDEDTPLGGALKKQLKLNLFDPWGLTQTNYKKLSILHFLEGRVSPGTKMHDEVSHSPVVPDAVIDAVVLLIPVGTSQDPTLLDTLSGHIKAILEFGIYPVVVINFINTLKSEEEIKKAYETIQHASGLAKKDVFLLDNYEHEQYRNMEKDLIYWKILQKLFSEIVKNIKKKQQGIAPQVSSITTSPIKPSSTSNLTSSTSKKICNTKECSNRGKVVDYPRCPFCGNPPEAEQPPVKVCDNNSCSNYLKEVAFPKCPFCGRDPVVKGGNTAAERICNNPKCSQKGQAVDANFPFCPHCGIAPTPGKSAPKIRSCLNTNCSNHGKEVPKAFPLCPYCGTEPAAP